MDTFWFCGSSNSHIAFFYTIQLSAQTSTHRGLSVIGTLLSVSSSIWTYGCKPRGRQKPFLVSFVGLNLFKWPHFEPPSQFCGVCPRPAVPSMAALCTRSTGEDSKIHVCPVVGWSENCVSLSLLHPQSQVNPAAPTPLRRMSNPAIGPHSIPSNPVNCCFLSSASHEMPTPWRFKMLWALASKGNS